MTLVFIYTGLECFYWGYGNRYFHLRGFIYIFWQAYIYSGGDPFNNKAAPNLYLWQFFLEFQAMPSCGVLWIHSCHINQANCKGVDYQIFTGYIVGEWVDACVDVTFSGMTTGCCKKKTQIALNVDLHRVLARIMKWAVQNSIFMKMRCPVPNCLFNGKISNFRVSKVRIWASKRQVDRSLTETLDLHHPTKLPEDPQIIFFIIWPVHSLRIIHPCCNMV